MEEELILQQPTDRRLENAAQLPPGPPGVELDPSDLEDKQTPPPAPIVVDKDAPPPPTPSSKLSSSSRRRSRSPSPSPRKRRSPSRGRRSPSPLRSRRSPSPVNRRRRSPSPRRSRYRDYSPDRRRFNRRRSPSPRDRRRNTRRSPSPPSRRSGGGGSRWSPKKKPNSPAPSMNVQGPPPPIPQSQYAVMPPQMYGGDAYVTANAGYNQYGVAQSSFAQPTDAYGMQATVGAPPPFNAAYPPPPSWDAYAHQSWMSQAVAADPVQMQQMQAPSVVGVGQLPPSAVGSVGTAHSALPDSAPGTVEPNPVHDAVAQEAENQRDELKRQRSSYLKKTSVLKKELRMLRDQRKDLNGGGAPPSPTTKGFIDENDKLQTQIQKKLNTIENVIDMLTGIIGDEKPDDKQLTTLAGDMTPDTGSSGGGSGAIVVSKKQRDIRDIGKAAVDTVTPSGAQSSTKKKRSTSSSSEDSSSGDSSTESGTSTSSQSSRSDRVDKGAVKAPPPSSAKRHDGREDDTDDSSTERLKNKIMESMKAKQKQQLGTKKDAPLAVKAKDEKSGEEKARFNYVFYDPEMHWCQSCDAFPKTAKDFLNHLHSKEHSQRERIDTPWHLDMITDQYPNYENAPTKRTPIRGLTFFVPSTAWFCKLCSIWMGDLHCASTHLKSQLHSKKYNIFLEKNPHFEVNWLADRQRVLNEKTATPLPPQITSISTTGSGGEVNGSGNSYGRPVTKEDEKLSKKRRKKSSDKKDKKKKKKRSKKRRRTSSTSSTSSESTTTSVTSDEPKKKAKKTPAVELPIQELDNPNPSASIRVTMRKQQLESMSVDDEEIAQPPASIKQPAVFGPIAPSSIGVNNRANRISKWTAADNGDAGKATTALASASATTVAATVTPSIGATAAQDDDSKRDDSIIQQWNTVQPVISDSEKKLLEQLKGKLKSKPREETHTNTRNAFSVAIDKERAEKERERERDKEKGKDKERDKEKDTSDKHAASSNNNNARHRDVVETDRERRRRTRSPYGRGGRSHSRSRGRGGGDYRRGRRSRSRSRGRGIGFGGRRARRSSSRSFRRRSRSMDRRRRQLSRSRSRTRSRTHSPSRNRIEKAVVRHSEFRPRVPEKDKEKKLSSDSKDRKESQRKSKSSASSSSAGTLGKKLPFIGKMPVFKKQAAGQSDAAAGAAGAGPGDKRAGDDTAIAGPELGIAVAVPMVYGVLQGPTLLRPPAPTAAQIQMAMMEDVYGNAPPFHPDAGMMMDYDDLMPDPVQFVNLMGQVPPPPPPTDAHGIAVAEEGDGDDDDMLPPGIDGPECEEYEAKLAEKEGAAGLPKDLEEALNLIFPGEKQPGEEDEALRLAEKKMAAGQTQIIVDEPIMQPEDLVREGIHMVTIEETTSVNMDELSQMSMNEPLVFNKTHKTQANVPASAAPAPPVAHTADVPVVAIAPTFENAFSPTAADTSATSTKSAVKNINKTVTMIEEPPKTVVEIPAPDDIPMPPSDKAAADAAASAASDEATSAVVYDLDDIPQPPDLPNDRDKARRQEEWDDLAMLGIDADDMAAQCI